MLKNVAGQFDAAGLLDTAGAAVTTGTTTVYLIGDNGTQASMGTATHKGNGHWTFAPSQAQTNYDKRELTWVNTGAVTVFQSIFTRSPYNDHGAMFLFESTISAVTDQSNIELTDAWPTNASMSGQIVMVIRPSDETIRDCSVIQSSTVTGVNNLALRRPLVLTPLVGDIVRIYVGDALQFPEARDALGRYPLNLSEAAQLTRLDTDWANNGRLDLLLDDVPSTAEFNARSLPATDLYDHTNDSLNGKGNWNVGKTGYTLIQTFPTNFGDMSINVTTGEVSLTTAQAQAIAVQVELALLNEADGNAVLQGIADQIAADWVAGDSSALAIATAVWAAATRTLSAGTNLNDLSPAEVAAELATYNGPTRIEATADKDAILAQGNSAWATLNGAATEAKQDLSAAEVTFIRASQVVASGTADSGTITTMVDAALPIKVKQGAMILFGAGGATNANEGKTVTITDRTGTTVTFNPPITAITTETYEVMPADNRVIPVGADGVVEANLTQVHGDLLGPTKPYDTI